MSVWFCPCPPQNVLGEPGKGFIYAMNAFDITRPAVSVDNNRIGQ